MTIVRSLSQLPINRVFKLMFDNDGQVYYDLLEEPSGYRFPIPLSIYVNNRQYTTNNIHGIAAAEIVNCGRYGRDPSLGWHTEFPKRDLPESFFDKIQNSFENGLTGEGWNDQGDIITPLSLTKLNLYLDDHSAINVGQHYLFKVADYLTGEIFDAIGSVVGKSDLDDVFFITINFHNDILKNHNGHAIYRSDARHAVGLTYATAFDYGISTLLNITIMKEHAPEPEPEPGDEESPLKPHKPKK